MRKRRLRLLSGAARRLYELVEAQQLAIDAPERRVADLEEEAR